MCRRSIVADEDATRGRKAHQGFDRLEKMMTVHDVRRVRDLAQLRHHRSAGTADLVGQRSKSWRKHCDLVTARAQTGRQIARNDFRAGATSKGDVR